MKQTFLDKVMQETRARLAEQISGADLQVTRERAEKARSQRIPHLFLEALKRADRINVIAEIKRRSPSKGVINDVTDISWTAEQYARGAAAAISVLTESTYFDGSINDLRAVSAMTDLPILRKDFIVDEHQVYEAAEAGADAVLLIVAALSEAELGRHLEIIRKLGMDALVEIHTRDEIEIAASLGAEIVGVNNRDLHSLEVCVDVSRSLIRYRPKDALMVAESGLSSAVEIAELRSLGFDGFLIGETLMKSDDPASTLRQLSQGAAV